MLPNVPEVLNEPTAAAIAYGLQDDKDQAVLVYDLGGGTFDVSIIEVKDGSVDELATGGDHELGGRDWDEEIVKYLAGRSGRHRRVPPRTHSDSAETRQDLWRRAEGAKRALTHRAETKIQVSHEGQRVRSR